MTDPAHPPTWPDIDPDHPEAPAGRAIPPHPTPHGDPPARSFGNPVPGPIAPNSADPDPPNFRCTRPYADGSLPQYGPHDGLDIGNGQSGDAILAMDDGTVYQAFFDAASGGAGIVRIDHGDGWTTGYAHMDAIYVTVGQQVRRGDKVARLDNSGWSSGAHLHMDTTHNHGRVDPWPLLEQNQGAEEEEEDPLAMAKYAEGDYERITNNRYRTLAGANFRKGTTTDAPILKTFDAGEQVVPHAKVKGPTTEAVDGQVWWYLAYKYAGGGTQEGAFHKSAIEYEGPVEEAGGMTQADVDKAAAEAAAEVSKAADAAAEEFA